MGSKSEIFGTHSQRFGLDKSVMYSWDSVFLKRTLGVKETHLYPIFFFFLPLEKITLPQLLPFGCTIWLILASELTVEVANIASGLKHLIASIRNSSILFHCCASQGGHTFQTVQTQDNKVLISLDLRVTAWNKMTLEIYPHLQWALHQQ